MTSQLVIKDVDILAAVTEKYGKEYVIKRGHLRVRLTGAQSDPTQHIEVVLEVETVPVKPVSYEPRPLRNQTLSEREELGHP